VQQPGDLVLVFFMSGFLSFLSLAQNVEHVFLLIDFQYIEKKILRVLLVLKRYLEIPFNSSDSYGALNVE